MENQRRVKKQPEFARQRKPKVAILTIERYFATISHITTGKFIAPFHTRHEAQYNRLLAMKHLVQHDTILHEFTDRRVGAEFLRQWELQQVEHDRTITTFAQGNDRVTVLADHFWTHSESDAKFDEAECAILETWRHCGIMKTVLVCNLVTEKRESFAARYSGHVTIPLEQSLIPNKVFRVNRLFLRARGCHAQH